MVNAKVFGSTFSADAVVKILLTGVQEE